MGTGQNIKALRKRDQLTQEEFAALIGVSKETVCRWEKDRYAIRRSTLLKIVSKFNLQLDDLTSETAGLAARLDHEERKGESREVITDSLCDVFKIQMNGGRTGLKTNRNNRASLIRIQETSRVLLCSNGHIRHVQMLSDWISSPRRSQSETLERMLRPRFGR